jgi:hypothetical protein
MLSTELTRTFGLKHPIVWAPMANWSGGVLAGAVSAGGGLGMIGVGSATPEAWIAEQANLARPHGTFGIGLLIWALECRPELLDAAARRSTFGRLRPRWRPDALRSPHQGSGRQGLLPSEQRQFGRTGCRSRRRFPRGPGHRRRRSHRECGHHAAPAEGTRGGRGVRPSRPRRGGFGNGKGCGGGSRDGRVWCLGWYALLCYR